MMVITAETMVGEIAVEEPTAIEVLERFGIDYCCGGKRTLAKACTERNLSVDSVLTEVERKRRESSSPEVAWQTAPLKDLIGHIVQKHHSFAREQLALAQELAAKVEHRHGSAHLEAHVVSESLAAMNAELTHHFFCEENVLFPYIAQLDESRKSMLPDVLTGMQRPVAQLMRDHDQTGDELGVLREATNNYHPPKDACTTYQALYRALEDLERDLHQHIHLENNILFPRALKLESEL
jgi:regulator of cell morphogenesis and NO signaling